MRYLMGTLVEIRLWDEPEEAGQAACREAFAEMRRLERSFSRFDPESELCRVVREANRHPVRVSADLLAVLSLAQRISESSRGAFDITVGAWTTGISRAETRARIGWEKIRLDPSAGTVRLDVPGMTLDLGAIGKGYAVDRAVEILQRAGIRRGLVDAGGNFKIFGFPETQRAGIEDPSHVDRLWGIVDLVRSSVSTSGNAHRPRHLLDPRTGCPTRAGDGAVVLANSAAIADGLSTALLVLGIRGIKLLPEYGAEGLLIRKEKSWTSNPLSHHVQPLHIQEMHS